jgi:hypothetical protein
MLVSLRRIETSATEHIYDANFVFGIRTSQPGDVEQLLARAAREYAHAARLTFRVDPFTPPIFEARLALEGYERDEALVMVLDGPLRKATSELKCMDWSEQAPRRNLNPEDMTTARALASSNRLKCPPVQYVLAYEDGRAIGHCNAWEGLTGKRSSPAPLIRSETCTEK